MYRRSDIGRLGACEPRASADIDPNSSGHAHHAVASEPPVQLPGAGSRHSGSVGTSEAGTGAHPRGRHVACLFECIPYGGSGRFRPRKGRGPTSGGPPALMSVRSTADAHHRGLKRFSGEEVPMASLELGALGGSGGPQRATGNRSPVRAASVDRLARSGVRGFPCDTTAERAASRWTYTFTVTATNAMGTGPPSADSNPVVPARAAPFIGAATTGGADVRSR